MCGLVPRCAKSLSRRLERPQQLRKNRFAPRRRCHLHFFNHSLLTPIIAAMVQSPPSLLTTCANFGLHSFRSSQNKMPPQDILQSKNKTNTSVSSGPLRQHPHQRGQERPLARFLPPVNTLQAIRNLSRSQRLARLRTRNNHNPKNESRDEQKDRQDGSQADMI